MYPHALAGPLESLQAVICNLYYASSPEKKVSTQRYQKRFFFFLPFYWIYLCRSTHSNFHLNEFHCYSVGHVKCLILSFDIGYYGYSYIFQSNKKDCYCVKNNSEIIAIWWHTFVLLGLLIFPHNQSRF